MSCERTAISIHNALSSPRSVRATLLVACIALVSLAFGACGAPATPGWVEKLRPCPTEKEIGRLEPWDRFELRVYDEAEMSGLYEVSAKGTIKFPRLGEIEVAGKRCDEIETLIADRLASDVLRNPSVVCVSKTMERTVVTVQGQVKSPGVVDFRKGLMLTDAIASSKGTTPRAQGNSVVITRKSADDRTVSVVVPYEDILSAQAENVCLHPGDIVFVPEAIW